MHDERGNASVSWRDAPEDYERPVLELRTFSKLYGLAGLRVGYGFGPVDVIDAIRRVQLPYNVNAMSQAAALASVDLAGGIEERVRANVAGRQQLSAGLDKLGVSYAPSQTNFVWVHLGARGLELVENMAVQGVLVRAGRGYDEPEYARVTIGLPEENDAFLRALEQALNTS
ncbi:MAG: aminotransferase class I/II-fold pyridoxal phosphate-dependent enzyme [Chloroflexota bacterium]